MIGGQGVDEKEMASVECFQNNRGHWEVLSDAPKPLVHAMVVGHGMYIYVFGGTDMAWNDSNQSYVFGTNRKSWQKLADMPCNCKFGSAVVWKDMIYVVGGFKRTCMSFNPALNVWTSLPRCRHEHADGPAFVWKGRILVCGGRSNASKRDDGTLGGTTVIDDYDPERNVWILSQIELPERLLAHFVFCTEDTH